MRAAWTIVVPVAIAALLAACSPNSGGIQQSAIPRNVSPPTGEILGTGTVRVALLLPISATGNAGTLAKDMKDAASMALQEFQNPNLQILVKDTQGTAAGARAATAEALSQGAELIIGPLFADSVGAASLMTKPARVPIIAFSSDTSRASNGVYLLSFLPQTDIERIIQFAVSRGKRSYAALLPANGYGTVVEAALHKAAGTFGGRIIALERYQLDRVAMQATAEQLADVVLSGVVDSVVLPDAGDAAPFLAQVMAAKGVTTEQITYLGSGQWDDARIAKESNLRGGWYPAPDKSGFRNFADRFRVAYGKEPLRPASLAYDAVSLAAGLSSRFGNERFSDRVLTNDNGFAGVDGIFRLRRDGTNQRGLAIWEITADGNPAVVQAAPASFRDAGL